MGNDEGWVGVGRGGSGYIYFVHEDKPVFILFIDFLNEKVDKKMSWFN